jgi:KilA-N domain
MAENIVAIGELVKAFEAAGIVVERDTKTGYFSATRMVENWNKVSGQKKRLDNFMKSSFAKEYIEALNEDLGRIATDHSNRGFAQDGSEDSRYRGTGKVFEVVKGGNLANRQQGTWMHPMLAIELAGWLNVRLKIACNRIIMNVMDGTLIIQAPIYAGRDRKEVIIEANQPAQIVPYNSDDYLILRKAEFGW